MSSLQAPAGLQPSASYSFTMRIELRQLPGRVRRRGGRDRRRGRDPRRDRPRARRPARRHPRRDVACVDAAHGERVVNAVKALEGVKVQSVSDRTFLMHKGGKIEIVGKVPIKTRDDLSMAYTPGVARVSSAIDDDPEAAWALTIKGNTVAVVSDGTAVLGLGDIGPEAAMPVMEGKAMLFKELAGVDAFPLCLSTTDVDEIVRIVEGVAPTFGGINLEDIAAPRCFEIERRLKESLDIPVFHDDQHGTAVVVLAALLNALKVVGKRAEDVRVVVVGAGAAGMACAKIILEHGVRTSSSATSAASCTRAAPELDGELASMAARTNPRGLDGHRQRRAGGRRRGRRRLRPRRLHRRGGARRWPRTRSSSRWPTRRPRSSPRRSGSDVAIMATGRSDYPNQINNVLAFPGIFRGALDVRASGIDEAMKLAAARAIAAVIPESDLGPEYIIPSVFNRDVAPAVAEAVAAAAIESGIARRDRASRQAEIPSA